MSELALKLIAENKAKHEQGEDASYLDLGRCGLTITPNLSSMDWLETLVLSNEWRDLQQGKRLRSINNGSKNTLKEVPASSLPENLHILYIDGDPHSEWKIFNWDFLTGLNNVQILGLSDNKIEEGSFLKGLINLQTLNLSNNQINNAEFLNDLTNLKNLDISNNQLSNVNSLTNLTRLQYLNLCTNQITNVDELGDLPNLRYVNLGSNQITDVEKLNKLNKLNILGVYNNQIHSISKKLYDILLLNFDITQYIEYLKEIKNYCVKIKAYELAADTRDVESKLIRIFEFFKIQKEENKNTPSPFFDYFLKWLFYHNPLQSPPLEIVEQGNDAILRYFEDLNQQGSDQIYEAKLLLIGEGGAGKTTLCRKLFDPYAPLPQEKDRTKGIDIHPLYFDIPEKPDKKFRLNIWDFAGQGKYQSAHSFFYTHRSLYVLVDDTRTLNENDAYRALYNNWLQTTELFGGQSPVVILHNEKDGCARIGFSLGGFQDRFSFVHGELFRINLGGNDITKITDLRAQIERQALVLPHIGDTVPKTWVGVREAIEQEKEKYPYISAERYRECCADQGITDPDRQADLSRYFHDLGVFLHFQDNPLLKRDVFLQNQWVTDAVYKILDDIKIAEEQRGRFTKMDLTRLWHESTYRARRDELLALMLQFELCYQVQGSETYVCPQLLPGDVTPYQLGTDTPLQLKYEYGFMPKGLLYRLIVRLHHHIAQGQTAVWNCGVVLERLGAQADIIESLDRRTISVRATGVRAKELVTIINEEVERLHAPFGERLKVLVKIPCNCRACRESDKPHFYDKPNLDNRLSKDKITVECDVSFEEVNVLGLLEGVFIKRAHFTPHQIKALIQSGQTAQALEALCELNYPDSLALKARFAAVQKEFLDGRIDFKEYELVRNQVNAGGLGLLG